MKNLFALPLIIAVAIFCSCQKHLTDEELQARIEREVKRQLAAEREAQEKELEQRRAQFNARRNALFEKRGNTVGPGNPRVPNRPSIREGSANPATAVSPGTIRTPRLPPGVTLPERAPGALPGRPVPGGRLPTTSESLAPPVTSPDSASPAFSPVPEAPDNASPTPTPASPEGTLQ
jgi:hypothetical protein